LVVKLSVAGNFVKDAVVEFQAIEDIRAYIADAPELGLARTYRYRRIYHSIDGARSAEVTIDRPFTRNLATYILKVLEEHDPLLEAAQLRESVEDTFDDQPSGHPAKDLAFDQTMHMRVVLKHPGWMVLGIVNHLLVLFTRHDVDEDVV
jgi:hypothetical protein